MPGMGFSRPCSARQPSRNTQDGKRSLKVTDFIEPGTGFFVEAASRHLLTREALRATRYQDFFSVCLLKPDVSAGPGTTEEDTRQGVSKKIAQFLRSTDMVATVADGP